jgi:outer membrane murein-binding lipoprotein Lpp
MSDGTLSLMVSSKARSLVSTAAIASVSALAVAVSGIAGFRSSRGEVDVLAGEVKAQRATIDRITSDLQALRDERDHLAAELRARATPSATPPKPRTARHDVDW